jgi:hypothetical protein
VRWREGKKKRKERIEGWRKGGREERKVAISYTIKKFQLFN